MNKIIIIGGAGFLGSNLCRYFVKNKEKVICIDNFTTGFVDNIYDLLDYNNFKLITEDIKTTKFSGEANIIYNFASCASPGWYKKIPLETIRTNFIGTDNLLEYALANKIKIVQISTIKTLNPFILDSNSCYLEGKRSAEVLCYEYNKLYNVDIQIVRLSHIYGPGMSVDDPRMVPTFITRALKNEKIDVYGEEEYFCYVDDIIEALVILYDYIGFNVFNVGGFETTCLDMAKKIVKFTDSRSEIISHEYPNFMICPEAYEWWKPKTSIDEGLKKTVNYFKEILCGKKE